MKTMKHNKWWILLLSMVFVVIGMACSSDEPDEPIGGITGGYWGNHTYYPRDGILVMQLDKKDSRFKDLKKKGNLKDVNYRRDKTIADHSIPMSDTLGIILRNDSIFLLHMVLFIIQQGCRMISGNIIYIVQIIRFPVLLKKSRERMWISIH